MALFCAVEPSPDSGLLPPQSTCAVPVAAGAAAELELLLLLAAGSLPQAASTRAALATMPTAPRGRMIFTAFPPLGDFAGSARISARRIRTLGSPDGRSPLLT